MLLATEVTHSPSVDKASSPPSKVLGGKEAGPHRAGERAELVLLMIILSILTMLEMFADDVTSDVSYQPYLDITH